MYAFDHHLRHYRWPPRSSSCPAPGAAGNLTNHTGRCLPAGKHPLLVRCTPPLALLTPMCTTTAWLGLLLA